jgi:dihydrolipoamide dehydrogenase
LNIDEIKIVSSTGALELTQVPKRLAVIGAGVIGLELGQVWSRLGAQVTVIEFLDRILPSFDAEIAKTAQRALSKRGLKFSLGRQVTGVEAAGDALVLNIRRKDTEAIESLEADIVLVAVGRRPVTTGLRLDRLNIARDQQGFIKVDHRFKTSVDGIYAIGDCVPGPMLAHKAEEDGVACVEGLAGLDSHVDYALVPSVVYTTPEVAGVGLAQEQLEASGVVYRTGSFPFIANSRARASGETDGLVKILAAEDGRILGAHIVGPHGGDLLAELVLAMKHGVKAEDVAGVCHAHPSLGEAVKEACLAVSARAIHC